MPSFFESFATKISRSCRALMAAAAVYAITSVTGGAYEVRAQTQTRLNPDLFGYLDQYSLPNLGPSACVPTSVANYMVYLQNKNPSTLGHQLAGSTEGDWEKDAEHWASLMGTTRAGGTSYGALVEQVGLKLNDCVHGGQCDSPSLGPQAAVSYASISAFSFPQNQPSFSVSGRNGSPPPTQRAVPFWSDFHHPLNTLETPVLATIMQTDGRTAHEILVSGISQDRLYFVDPLDPADLSHPQQTKTTEGILTRLTNPTTFASSSMASAQWPEDTLLLSYDQYACETPNMGRICAPGTESSYISNRDFPSTCVACPDPTNLPSGGCPADHWCAPPTALAHYLIAASFWIDFDDPSAPAANASVQIPSLPLIDVEIAGQAKLLDCLDTNYGTHQRDTICRTRHTAKRCNETLERRLESTVERYGLCGAPSATELTSRNHASASARLAAAGVDIAEIGKKGFKCSNQFGRAIANHARCEYETHRLEEEGLDAWRKRDYCDLRLRSHFDRARNLYGDSCPAVVDLSEVISTNRNELTPATIYEVLENQQGIGEE